MYIHVHARRYTTYSVDKDNYLFYSTTIDLCCETPPPPGFTGSHTILYKNKRPPFLDTSGSYLVYYGILKGYISNQRSAMAKQIKVSDKVHADLKAQAEVNFRSIAGELEALLYGGTPVETGGTPKNLKLGTLPPVEQAEYHRETPKKIASEPSGSGATGVGDLFNEGEPLTITTPDMMDGELQCCNNPNRPCKHWVWNTDREGYVNSLSGRFKEAEE